jgi:hypothetical protein
MSQLTTRFGGVCDRLVASRQSVFIRVCFILESVVSANEVIHSVVKNKETSVLFKLDYEKAYDRVSWTL